MVQRSVELGEPVIYVNFNYRLNAFGWLSGKEALAGGAANVGLYDREDHFDYREPPWALTLCRFNLNANSSEICQKRSSWLGSRLTFPSSAVIRAGLLCEFYPSPRHQLLTSIAYTIQLGAERRSPLYHGPPRHNPCRPSIQGCHHRGFLQSQNLFRRR